MAVQLRVVSATPDLLVSLPSWFVTPEALAQWGGSEIRFPLDASQVGAMLAQTRTKPPHRLAFVGLVDGDTAAHCQIVLDWTNGTARLARFAVAPVYRGQGLARPFLTEVFARLGQVGDFPRLELNVYTFNAPAIALYESLGFIREGVRRSSVRVGNARWDTAIYAIVRDR